MTDKLINDKILAEYCGYEAETIDPIICDELVVIGRDIAGELITWEPNKNYNQLMDIVERIEQEENVHWVKILKNRCNIKIKKGLDINAKADTKKQATYQAVVKYCNLIRKS